MSEYISDLIILKEEIRKNFFNKNRELIEEFTILVNNIILTLSEKEEFSCTFGIRSKINDIKYKTIRSIVLLEYIKKGYNFKQSADGYFNDGYSQDKSMVDYLEFTL